MAKDPTGPGLGGALAETLARVDGLVLRIGWLDPEAAAIAAPNELGGDPGPPQRATLEPALDESRDLIGDLTAEAVRDAAAGRSARPALERLGRRLEDEVRARILAGPAPPNAPSTVRRKGYDAPLRGPQDRILEGVASEVERE